MNHSISFPLRGLATFLLGCASLFAQVAPPPGPKPEPPTLRILQPTNHTEVIAGTAVSIVVQVSTNAPDGHGPVSVFSDDRFIGVAEPMAQIAIFPPPPPQFSLVWSNAPVGAHRVVASMIFAGSPGGPQSLLVSQTVSFQVVTAVPPTNDVPVVTVRTLLAQIEEGAGPRDVFEVRRTGPVDRTLVVGFRLAGTATVGVDYALPFNLQLAEFARGADTARVVLRPAGDSRTEGRESVVLELRPPVPSSVTGARPPYVLGEPIRAESHIVDRVPPPAPSIAWQAPTNGTPFHIGDVLHLRVVATDPQGYLPDVEFLASDASGYNTRRIGTSAIRFLVAPTNGTPIAHELEWVTTNAFAGANRIVARAPRADGTILNSAVLGLTGNTSPQPPALPVVTVQAIDASGSETNVADTITFEVRRTGPLDEALGVHFVTLGSAQYLADYRRSTDPTNAGPHVALPAPLVFEIPAGRTNATVEFVVIPDTRQEGDETVVVDLIQPVPAPNVRLRKTYEIGRPDSARAVIHDTPVVEAPPAVVSVVATASPAVEPGLHSRGIAGTFTLVRTGPTNRAVTVNYSVSGTARNGRDYEYLDGDATLAAGATRRDIRIVPLQDLADEGRETVLLRMRPGRGYVFGDSTNATVFIDDASGPTNAEPSLVITRPADESRLQGPTNVVIQVTAIDPEADIRRVEFLANSHVIGVSEQLTRDAVIPGAPRHHEFTWTNPPAGSFRLQARAAVRRQTVLSDGVDIIVVTPPPPPVVVYHPADTAARDLVLGADEFGTYSRAWRTGAGWSNRPTVIPPSYVARAGFLLQSGGAYEYRPRQGPAPLFWVPAAGTNGSTATGVAKSSQEADSTEAKDDSHAVFSLVSDTALSGVVDASAPVDPQPEASVDWPEGLPGRAPLSFAIVEIPAGATEAAPTPITLRALPATGVKSHVIELAIGIGATATNISDDGVLDTRAGVIRWGPFNDDANRRITATLVNASPRDLGGVASFDGYDTRIRVGGLPSTGSGQGPRIASIEPRTDGSMQLLVVDDSGSVTAGGQAIEVSSDLHSWHRVQQTSSGTDCSAHLDSDAIEDSVRYYRVVTE